MNRRVFLAGIVVGACTSSAQARRRWRRLRSRRKKQAEEEAPENVMTSAEYEKCRTQRQSLFAQRASLKRSQRVMPSERMVQAVPELAREQTSLTDKIDRWRQSAAAYNVRCTTKFHRFNGQWFRSPPLNF